MPTRHLLEDLIEEFADNPVRLDKHPNRDDYVQYVLFVRFLDSNKKAHFTTLYTTPFSETLRDNLKLKEKALLELSKQIVGLKQNKKPMYQRWCSILRKHVQDNKRWIDKSWVEIEQDVADATTTAYAELETHLRACFPKFSLIKTVSYKVQISSGKVIDMMYFTAKLGRVRFMHEPYVDVIEKVLLHVRGSSKLRAQWEAYLSGGT